MINVETILEKISKKKLIKRVFILLLSSLTLALTYNLFLLPNNLVAGGTSGISIILNDYIPPFIVITTVNIALLIIGFFALGKEKIVGSIIDTFTFPLFVALTQDINKIFNINSNDMILTVIFAGSLIGLSIGNIVKSGFSPSGTGIAAQIVAKAFKISTGRAHIIIDGTIILGGIISFGFFPTLYGLAILYVFTLVSDKVILGTSNNKIFYIITNKQDEVKEYILKTLHQGITLIKAQGGYKNTDKEVLLCVVPAKYYFKLKEGVNLIDSEAFFIVTDAYEVGGGLR